MQARGLIDLARGAGAQFSGPLEVGSIQTLGPYYLPRVLRQVRQAFPDVALRLTEGQTDTLVASLRAGALDALLLALPLPGSGLASKSLFFEPFVVICPRLHPLTELTRLEMKDLSADDLILLEEGHCLRDDVLRTCVRGRKELHRVFETDQLASIFQFVRSGFGLTVVPAMTVPHAAGCKLIPLRGNSFRRIGYLRARRHIVSRPMREFTAWLRTLVSR